MTLQELSENTWDIGTVLGVLHGIGLTPALLPNQKEAIVYALKAMQHIKERNEKAVLEGSAGLLKGTESAWVARLS